MLTVLWFNETRFNLFFSAYPLTVVLGAHNLTKEEKKSRQERKVSHYHRHPLHENITQLSYDIMLLKVCLRHISFLYSLFLMFFVRTVNSLILLYHIIHNVLLTDINIINICLVSHFWLFVSP